MLNNIMDNQAINNSKNNLVAAIHVEDMTMAYREVPVLWDIDIDIPQGSMVAIIGPNGAGKSTLIKGIMNLLPRLSGQVEVFGMPLKKVYKEIAYVPQIGEVNWDFPTTVLDVTMMGRYPELGLFKRIRKEDKKRALASLEIMGLREMQNRQISELSGGQRQRAFLARALCQDAKLYILDEPLQGVDKKTEKMIINQLFKLKDAGNTVICVHHDLNTVRDYFDYVVIVDKVLIASGPVDSTFNEPNLTKAYGANMQSIFMVKKND